MLPIASVLTHSTRTEQPFTPAQYGHFAQSSVECVPGQVGIGTGVSTIQTTSFAQVPFDIA